MKKVAFVTGGSRGIGKEITQLLAKNGYCVSFTYNKSEREAKDIVSSLLKENYLSMAIECDVSDFESVKNAIKKTVECFGHITLLVNNAGISIDGIFTETTLQQWNDIISVNVNSLYNCCYEILPSMIRNHYGNIINISSIWGEVGASCEVAYSTSKAAVIGFTKALAKEVAPSGIRVNCIAPGVIKTDMLNGYSDDDLEQLKNDTPIGRLGAPFDVANAVKFLASDDSSFITGQVLGISGGFVI